MKAINVRKPPAYLGPSSRGDDVGGRAPPTFDTQRIPLGSGAAPRRHHRLPARHWSLRWQASSAVLACCLVGRRAARGKGRAGSHVLRGRRALPSSVAAAGSRLHSGGGGQGGGQGQERVVITDLLARSFLRHFNNAFLNTIEKMRAPHLERVLSNLKDFASRVPGKYRRTIQDALRTEGLLSFLLSRAALSLLCARATLPRSPGGPVPSISREHEEVATVVEELYIAAMLHAEKQWDVELKEDGKMFMAVAASFVRSLADPRLLPLKQANIQSAVLGLDANPIVWTQYGLDLLGISFDASFDFSTATSRPANWKVSLLGGDSLYATAQWAMANLDSHECRKLIAKTIAMYSDGQLRKQELLWDTEVTLRQHLDLEKSAGVAAFFGASSACAALVNGVDREIADQITEYGFDIGLIVALLKETRTRSLRSALKLGRLSAPIILALEQDDRLRQLLESRVSSPMDLEEALVRVQERGIRPTLALVNRLGSRAAARLESLEDSEEKEALKTITLGIACLPQSQEEDEDKTSAPESPDVHPSCSTSGSGLGPGLGWGGRDAGAGAGSGAAAEMSSSSSGGSSSSSSSSSSSTARVSTLQRLSGTQDRRSFDLKVENLRLRAEMQRLRSRERAERQRLETIRQVANDLPSRSRSSRAPAMVGLGLNFDAREVDWLLLRGLERRAPLPECLELDSLLACVAEDQLKVQKRLLDLSNAAESRNLKRAVREVFSAGGKRLRPALCLLVHHMLRPSENPRTTPSSDAVLTLATAIEVIHTASLLHDDILDDAEMRRQQKTLHRVFGPDVAVLSGDFLFAHASGLIETLEDDEVTRLVSLVIEQFGHGELAQSAKRFDASVSLMDYMKKSFYKTASLLAAACRASAVLSGRPREVCDVLYTYGFYLGIAFQIADDILDLEGTGQELGKPPCQDLREGLLTAPVLLCLAGNEDLGLAPADCSGELRAMVHRRFCRDGDLDRAAELVRQGGGLGMAYQLADQMARKAQEALTLVAPVDCEAGRALAGLTKWAVRRSS